MGEWCDVQYGVRTDLSKALDGVSEEWRKVSSKYWGNLRDTRGESNNPDWYPGMWEIAWAEYLILASEALKEIAQ